MKGERDHLRVALLGHRLATGTTTGIGRYYRELPVALAAAAPSAIRYVAASPAEGQAPDWVRPPLEYRALRGPRRALQAGWTLLRRPRVDRSLGRPDLVHTMHPWTPTPSRAPLVVTVHDLMPVLHRDWFAAHHRHGLVRGLKYARDHAVHLMADSTFTAEMLHAHLGVEPERVTVVHLGLDEEFRVRPSEDAIADTCARSGVTPGRYVIAVGAVTRRKNLTTVVDALAELEPDVLDRPALLAVGPTPESITGLEAALERAADDVVRFTGFVTDPDLRALLAGALALVHPSLDEGFGFTPLEAMALGTPALASTSGSLPEMVGDGGALLPPDDPSAWAAAITRLREEPEWRAELVAAGLRHQAGFRWDRTAADVLAIHLDVLGITRDGAPSRTGSGD